MKKLFLLIFFVTSSAFAAAPTQEPDPEMVCNTSDVCRKACELKLTDKLQDATPEQQKMIMQCAQDILKRFNVKQ